MPEITPLTPARVAIVDPATGGVTRPWYMFFQSLYQSAQNAVLNYIGAAPPADGQLLRYDAAGQGWTNSTGLTVNATGDVQARSLVLDTGDSDNALIVKADDGFGSVLILENVDTNLSTQFFALGTGVQISSPNVELYSENDFQVAVGGVNCLLLSGANGFLSLGVGSPPTPTAQLDISSNTIRLRNNKTPTSATASGNKGDICWDTSYIYVCVATNTWKRTAISTW